MKLSGVNDVKDHPLPKSLEVSFCVYVQYELEAVCVYGVGMVYNDSRCVLHIQLWTNLYHLTVQWLSTVQLEHSSCTENIIHSWSKYYMKWYTGNTFIISFLSSHSYLCPSIHAPALALLNNKIYLPVSGAETAGDAITQRAPRMGHSKLS